MIGAMEPARMKTTVAVAIVLVVTAGCAMPPRPAAVEVGADERRQYWVDRDPFKSSAPPVSRPCRRGTVTAAYTIDSDGYVSNVDILRSSPSDLQREDWMRHELIGRRFVPTEANKERASMRVQETFDVDCPPFSR
jgi:hypothetical protein